ncbi:MAG TPA: SDR family oxidoreductase [Pseudolabrys sp.]|jgi:NAD(P)-dependent dehydrogenase (short-subunit alcohol dehydrogenase family)
MSLQGQRIVLLGGTSGIGFATAEAAAREGAQVVVVSSRQQSVDRAVAALPKGAQGFARDLSREEAIAKFFETIGTFDHLVYTAGENLQLSELSTTSLDWARQFWNVRYWGAVAAVKYGSPHIRRGGSIVLTSGIANLRPRKAWTVAASICGAMEGLTRALAVELAPIRVNAVSPGVVKTPLWGAMGEAEREAMYSNIGAALPVGRVGEPEDIAEAYLYLMRQGFGSGHVVVVDGGTLLV